MNKYARRQNTDYWRGTFRRLVWDGERLKEKRLESLEQFDDLKEYKSRVDEWIGAIARQIHMVYQDDSLKDEIAGAVENVDLNNDSWLDAFEKLRAHIDGQIQRLNALTDDTLSSERSTNDSS